VPEDLAVAGIDNNPEAATANPGLTTVHNPFYEMGVQAGEILKKLADEPNSGPHRVLLEPKLVVRASTGG
jgi:LacI family transcriptional regulator